MPVAGEAAGVRAPLTRNNDRDALGLEPAEQPPYFGPYDGLVGKTRKEGLEAVQHDPLGAHLVDLGTQADEQALEVVFAVSRTRSARRERDR